MPGLRFLRGDLHTHTCASACYRHSDHTPQQMVQSAISRGLSAIGITDHNTADWIDAMRQAAQGTSLVVFPGVEISMNEGYHLVALFDPSTEQKHVEGFLGAIDIKPEKRGKQDALCTKSAYEVINTIHEWRGLAVLAHIDRPKGAFYEQAKQQDGGKIYVPLPCSTLFNVAEYDAVECVGGCLPAGFDEMHNFKRWPAVFQASDNPDSENPTRHSLDGLGALHSWFKLDEINLEGLRQCFADPEVRIRLMGDEEKNPCPKVVSLNIGDSGFLRNQRLDFNDGLNSIIGGKGVGKSLVVEFLRFGLGQLSTDPNLSADVHGKLDKRLGVDNAVKIVYELPDGTQYEIGGTYAGKGKGTEDNMHIGQHVCTNLVTGADYSGDIPQMFPILAYSQTEVIKIAENPKAQLDLIDRFIDTSQFQRNIAEIGAKLVENDAQLCKSMAATDKLESCEKQISTLVERIAAINRSLSDPIFDAMKAAESKRRTFESQKKFVSDLAALVSKWQNDTVKITLDPLAEAHKQDADLQRPQETAEGARQRIIEGLTALITDLTNDQQVIDTAMAVWMPQFTEVENKYVELLKTIGGDRSLKEKERRSLEQEKNALDSQAKSYREQTSQLTSLLETRDQLLNGLEQAHLDFFGVRKAKFDHLTQLSDGKLQLTITHAADLSVYEKNLNDLLKGGSNALSTTDRRLIAERVVPRRLVQMVLERDVAHLAAEASISETWARRVVEKLWSRDDFAEVLALQHNSFPTDVPVIRFRKAGNQYEPLNELSVGQKCTALLIIALCDGTMPVVIDQPEDALDIVSVWEDIAKKLRRGKKSRQFILTTHNSTVAVAADSDQFIIMEAAANRGRVIATGAIDREDVREAVIKHLEGGKLPHGLRSKKYNIASPFGAIWGSP